MTTTRKPRLLIATDNFLPRWDGVARFLDAVLPYLTEHFAVTVISPDFGPIDNKHYKHIALPLRRRYFGDIKLAKFRYRAIKKAVAKSDIVFTQTIGPVGALAIIAAKKKRKPLVSFIHSIETRLVPMAVGASVIRKILFPLMHRLVKYLYNKPQLLLTPSGWVEDVIGWEGVRTEKRVVRLGVDTERFVPGKANELRAKLGIGENDIVIGQHGRLAREKDLRTLLRAFIRIQAKHPEAKLLVIGEGIPSIKHMLSRREGVILPGKQDDVVPYLQTMDIFALTSMTETTCLAALEAMSTGLPLVSTPVGFVKDYITDGKNGFFFPLRDAYELSKKLEWLIEHPTLRERMGKEGRTMVAKHFDWKQTAVAIERALRDVLRTYGGED